MRLKSLRSSRVVETSALLNTGFTSNELDVHIPQSIAIELGLWPPPSDSMLEVISTPGGHVLSYYTQCCRTCCSSW